MRRRSLFWAGALLLVVWLAGCGGGGDSIPIVKNISISPNSPSVRVGGEIGFSAVVVGLDNKQVTWSVQPNGTGGTITQAGVYTAPANAGIFTVTATCIADANISASVPVNVTPNEPIPPPSVVLSATPLEINQGEDVLVKWTSQNATSVIDSNFGATTVSGQMVISPLITTELTIKVLGRDGTIAEAAPVTIKVKPVKLEGLGRISSDDLELYDQTYAEVKSFTATKDGDVEVSMVGDGTMPITTPYIFVGKGEAQTAEQVMQMLGPYFQYAHAQFSGFGTSAAKGYFRAEKGKVYTIIFNTWPINEYGTYRYKVEEIAFKGKNMMTPAQIETVKKRNTIK
jgi:hypothetical protein